MCFYVCVFVFVRGFYDNFNKWTNLKAELGNSKLDEF